MSKMKLQVNDSGSWRNIIAFDSEDEATVKEAAVMLLKVADGKKIVLRLSVPINGLDHVKAICRPPTFEWRE